MITPKEPALDLSEPVSERDHVRGAATAPVTLVEYGDFQCQYCARAYPVVRELERRFGKDLRVVFRHNPRVFDHPRAPALAEAAEAAADQGKFWEMHDLLFENQSQMQDGDFVGHANRLGLDVERFSADMKAGAHAKRVHAHELSGVKSHVLSTPTFFINGMRFNDTPDLETLSRAISAAL